MNCRRENIIICFSPLVKRFIKKELYENQVTGLPFNTVNKMFGCSVSDIWPYNEIVVYDVVNTCYHPELIIKIDTGSFYAKT